MDKSGLPSNRVAVDADGVPSLDATEGELVGGDGVGEVSGVLHGTSWAVLPTSWPARGGPCKAWPAQGGPSVGLTARRP